MKDKSVMTGRVSVYVPVDESCGIKLGSGIVGQERGNGEVEIYFEGNLYGAVNLVNYAERCYCAAGRMKTRYPTIAYMVVKAESLRYIGDLDLRSGDIQLVVDPLESTIASWVDLRDERELSAPSIKLHLEYKVGQAIMRQPARHMAFLAELRHLSGKARTDAITQAARSLDEEGQ